MYIFKYRCYPINDQRKRTCNDMEETFISLENHKDTSTFSNMASNNNDSNELMLKKQLEEALNRIHTLENILNVK